MSERIDQFADGLGQRLTTIEKMIDEAKIGLEEAKGKGKDELRLNSQSVRHKFELARQVAWSAEFSMNKWVKAKESSSTYVVQGSKDESEGLNLERQAASAEDDAEAGISLAEAAVVNAIVATYEAIDAHRAAEQPQSS